MIELIMLILQVILFSIYGERLTFWLQLVVIIETKGDHQANEETLAKLHLGRAWQEQAGPGYRYFLVFQDKDISMTGAYPMSEFLKILAEL